MSRSTNIAARPLPRAGLLARCAIAIAAASVALPALAQQVSCENPETRSTEYRIVGGRPADVKNWPFIVNLQHPGTAAGASGFCGGSLIDRQWVLTAGHCTKPLKPNNVIVRQVGPDGRPADPAYRVVGIYMLQNFGNDRGLVNDVALLKLERPANIAPRDLATLATAAAEQAWSGPNTCAEASGWGDKQQGLGQGSNLLLQVDLPIVSQAECASRLAAKFTIRSDQHVCAGYPEGTKDTCQGDSGGPLAVRAGPTGNMLVGVVSFGSGCAQPGAPGVYARVSTFRDWILSTIRSN